VRWLVLLVVVRPAFAVELSLGEALERAGAGPEARLISANAAVVATDRKTAAMIANPQFTVGGGSSDPLFSAGLAWTLPLFGQRGVAIVAAEASAKRAALQADLERWQLRRRARLAYYDAARAAELAEVARQIAALTSQSTGLARSRAEVGTGTQLDAEQAALAALRADQRVRDEELAVSVTRVELGRILGIGEPVQPTDALGATGATPDSEALLAAIEHHWALRGARAAVDAARAHTRSARAQRRPQITLEAALELSPASACDGKNVCVGGRGALGLPLPLGNLNGGPIARAEAEERVAEAQAELARLGIRAAIASALTSLEAARRRVRFYDDEYLPAAVSAANRAADGFRTGRTALLPLLEAQRAVLDARTGRVAALYDVQAARADLEEASGVALSAP
jgi:cobalt-zinc-cadmium efflux system outer membrane protein